MIQVYITQHKSDSPALNLIDSRSVQSLSSFGEKAPSDPSGYSLPYTVLTPPF